MEIIENYNLPDQELLESDNEHNGLMVWVPKELMVVIGKGSNPELELIAENIDADNIPVIRRGTGGCAVILSPEMAVVSLALRNDRQRKNNEYFAIFNNVIINTFRKLGIDGIVQAGISDITSNGLKVAGSSIYRNKDMVFYHAIINIEGETDYMERYLKIPPRYPDYRNGQPHKDFVTSFKAQGHTLDLCKFEQALKTEWLLRF
jgi:lipoate-protein ligase A